MDDADIKSLSACEYMGEEQLSYFLQRLLTMQSTLRERMAKQVSTRERHADEADQAAQDENYWINVHLKERDSVMLKDVEAALRKLHIGDYGYCDDTGDEIGFERLMANPAASLCTEAMERRERQQRLQG